MVWWWWWLWWDGFLTLKIVKSPPGFCQACLFVFVLVLLLLIWVQCGSTETYLITYWPGYLVLLRICHARCCGVLFLFLFLSFPSFFVLGLLLVFVGAESCISRWSVASENQALKYLRSSLDNGLSIFSNTASKREEKRVSRVRPTYVIPAINQR